MKRSKLSIRKSIARLKCEELIPINQLTTELQVSKESMIRWGIQGRSGTFLDVVHQPHEGWLTSRPALERFTTATGVTIEPRREKKWEMVSAETLAAEVGVSKAELISWMLQGIDGHVLRGQNLGHAGWHATREAVERFLEATQFDERETAGVELSRCA